VKAVIYFATVVQAIRFRTGKALIPRKGDPSMNRNEFAAIRRYLEKTQSQIANLLGTSLKAIQSFEQGWRKVPVHIERQLLFVLAQKDADLRGRRKNCWRLRNCPKKSKANCPAWEFKLGHLCWFVNGNICHGTVQESWERKMQTCRECDVFHSTIPEFLSEPAYRWIYTQEPP
jgi:DNA-binding transcriptional regulator YiaG